MSTKFDLPGHLQDTVDKETCELISRALNISAEKVCNVIHNYNVEIGRKISKAKYDEYIQIFGLGSFIKRKEYIEGYWSDNYYISGKEVNATYFIRKKK